MNDSRDNRSTGTPSEPDDQRERVAGHHVAIIGADFTPSSLPPAQRIRFFASHLAEFGWRPTVITTDPLHY